MLQAQLKKNYYALLLPALLAIAMALTARAAHLIDPGRWDLPRRPLGTILFIMAVVCSASLPVFVRTLFAHRMRHARYTPHNVFVRFQKWLLRLSLMSPYLVLIGCLTEPPRLYQTGTVLAALYAAYYYYPSQQRIDFDRRIFRVA